MINGNVLILNLFIIFLLITNSFEYTAQNLDTDLKFIRICNLTSPISLETMNEVLIYKKLSDREASAFKCFLHCLFTKYGWMDEDGGFLLHDIKKTLEEAEVEVISVEYILYKCTDMNSVDRCERSYLFTECFWDKMSEQQPYEDQLFYETDGMK